ncbi:YibE/F family protein [Oleidesulfovibrio sp.]|uniref:YibE/F family protein n=1 Tax=Oleidesulfovibrio sp. TaxID=2909707 RepID=UPI003A8A0978
MHKGKMDTVLVLVFAVLSLALWYTPTGFENRMDANAIRCKGRVVSESSEGLQQHTLIKVGYQALEVEALDGPYKGQRFSVLNQLQGRMDIDKVFSTGDAALLVITHKADGRVDTVVAQDHYRLGMQVWLLLGFGLLLLAFGGWTGAKALLSFVFTALVLWKIFVPLLLKGVPPVPLAFCVVAVLTAVIVFLVAGLTRLGVTAFLGAMAGVGASSLLAVWVADALHLHGAVMPFAETMLYAGYAHLNITDIYVAAIFVAASGAVMDLAMDVAASQYEVACSNPDISRSGAFLSGIRVGRAVVGTMTTTLLLAYSGGFITLLMAFMAQGVPLANMFNMIYVSAEIVKTLIGSLGLVLVAPFTAVVGALLFAGAAKDKKTASLIGVPGAVIPVRANTGCSQAIFQRTE